MYIELFFKIGYVRKIPKGFGMEQAPTQFAVKILCDDYADFNEAGNYFASDADTLMDIVSDLDEDKFRLFTFNRNIY